jgi:Leucine-rich repeat (LRR) protein
LKIDSFSHGAIGKFIGLYGLEDLFENLPDSLETLKIKNNDRNDIIITIPEDIDRFQNLEFLNFENCVDSVPESICNLKKLRFLTLQGNSKLRTVPGCIASLPNIVFLNVKECPNLEIPQEISDNANDFGNGMWDFAEDED